MYFGNINPGYFRLLTEMLQFSQPVSVTYENERISIKNRLPYLKCVLRLCDSWSAGDLTVTA